MELGFEIENDSVNPAIYYLMWRYMPVISALRKLRQEDHCKFINLRKPGPQNEICLKQTDPNSK